MNVNLKRVSDWERCDTGLLTRISNREQAAVRRRVALLRIGSAAAVALVLAGGTWGITALQSGNRENYFGGIACGDVRDNMQGYMAGELPEELTRKLETHLAQCPHCQELMKKMQGKAPGRVAVGMESRRVPPIIARTAPPDRRVVH